MRALDYEWKTDDATKWHRLWFVGDQHYGAAGCSLKKMARNRDHIAKQERARVVLMGDCCDFINMSDPRFDFQEVAQEMRPELDDLARVAANHFVKFYEPLRGKIICLIPGNHDKTVGKFYHFNVLKHIAENMGIPLLATVSRLTVYVTERPGSGRGFMVAGILSHAKKGAQTLGGKVAAAEKMFDFHRDVDFFAQAHMHEYLTHEGVQIGRKGKKDRPRIAEFPRVLILTGGYLRTYNDGLGGYGEDRGYRPTKLGSPHLAMRLKRTSYTRNGKHLSKDIKVLRAV